MTKRTLGSQAHERFHRVREHTLSTQEARDKHNLDQTRMICKLTVNTTNDGLADTPSRDIVYRRRVVHYSRSSSDAGS